MVEKFEFMQTAMVKHVPWFSPIHYEILNFFDNHDIQISPRDLARNIDYDRSYTGKECRTLATVGLLESESGLYSLSQMGKEFLEGKLNPSKISRPE